MNFRMKSEIKSELAFNRLGLSGLNKLHLRINERANLLYKERTEHCQPSPVWSTLHPHDLLSPVQRSILHILGNSISEYDYENTPAAAKKRNLERARKRNLERRSRKGIVINHNS